MVMSIEEAVRALGSSAMLMADRSFLEAIDRELINLESELKAARDREQRSMEASKQRFYSNVSQIIGNWHDSKNSQPMDPDEYEDEDESPF